MLFNLSNNFFSLVPTASTPYLCSNPSAKFQAFSVLGTKSVYASFVIVTAVGSSGYGSSVGVATHVSAAERIFNDVGIWYPDLKNGVIISLPTLIALAVVNSVTSVPIIRSLSTKGLYPSTQLIGDVLPNVST